ncbi:phage integrase SAM-like domain-containing protein [Alistipes sp. An116]|uniref:phage integrase SAM-like domain-containing protein n=1 Tax=Alistipes sp. An116 TaxID=1965546 RepID=UPI0011788FEB
MQGAVGHQSRSGNGVRYETTLRLTEEFLQKNYQKEDCYLDEVTNQFIEDFEFFLKTVRRCCPLQRGESQPRTGRGALLESDA